MCTQSDCREEECGDMRYHIVIVVKNCMLKRMVGKTPIRPSRSRACCFSRASSTLLPGVRMGLRQAVRMRMQGTPTNTYFQTFRKWTWLQGRSTLGAWRCPTAITQGRLWKDRGPTRAWPLSRRIGKGNISRGQHQRSHGERRRRIR